MFVYQWCLSGMFLQCLFTGNVCLHNSSIVYLWSFSALSIKCLFTFGVCLHSPCSVCLAVEFVCIVPWNVCLPLEFTGFVLTGFVYLWSLFTLSLQCLFSCSVCLHCPSSACLPVVFVCIVPGRQRRRSRCWSCI